MLTCKGCGRDDLASEAILAMHQRFCSGLQKQDDKTVGRLSIPEADPHYLISELVRDQINRVLRLVEKQPENLALIGPKGSGKTALARQIGALRQSPTLIANTYNWRSSDEVFGYETIHPERGLEYTPSLLVEALETPGATVVLNDFALMQNRAIQNGLNDILDYGLRQAWVDQIAHALGRPVRVAERVLIIATWNEGSEYTGNIKLSANIVDRFPNRIYMDYPPTEIQTRILQEKGGVSEERASILVRYAEVLRNLEEPIQVSMRGLIQAAKCMVLGANLNDAVYFTFVSGLNLDQQVKAMSALESFYTPEEKELVTLRSDEWVPFMALGKENNADS